MNPQNITVGTNTYSLVSMPVRPGPKSVTFTLTDAVGTVQSPFSLQTQTQVWPGADVMEAQVHLPPMDRPIASQWIAWLAQLRGKQCVFMLGDPQGITPQGSAHGSPVIDGSVPTNNTASTTVLFTKGWTASTYRLLLPGDYMQIGNRVYMCLDSVNSNANGNAQINVWPSIREQPADVTPITLHNAQGLFRLSNNKRQWNYDVAQLYGISFDATEVR